MAPGVVVPRIVRADARFDAPYFQPLAARALPALAAVLAAAVLTSVVGFGRQMQRALAPSPATGAGGAARFTRTLAHLIVGRHAVAVATSDFMLLTLARCRAQQTPIAMNAAVGVALVLAALTQVHDLASLIRPRTVTLWIPLVLAYWMTIGVRAALFIPSELPSSWTFGANAPEPSAGYWSAVRAVTLAVVLPPMLAVTAMLTVPLFGWSVAVVHALVTCAVVTLLAESMALTLDFVPFTRPVLARARKTQDPMAVVTHRHVCVRDLAGQARAANPWRRVVHPVDGGLGRRRDCLPRMAGATTSVCVDGRAARRTT